MHWAQFIATCASFAVIAAAVAGILIPLRARREARVAAKVIERDAALKAAITAGIIEQTEQIKRDTIARIDESDEVTRTRLDSIEQRTADMDRKLAVQFGGNGGGMRQAINEHGERLSYLAGRIDQIAGGK